MKEIACTIIEFVKSLLQMGKKLENLEAKEAKTRQSLLKIIKNQRAQNKTIKELKAKLKEQE